MNAAPKPRPKYYDVNLAHLPPPGLVSIFHRVSGTALFFPVLPILLYVLHVTLASPEGFARWHEFFDRPVVKAIVIAATWVYAHHFFAGLRYLVLDLHVGVNRLPARRSAVAVLVLGAVTTLLVAWRIW
jgi:succinate dehydrogenase / fumarate reductase cytochrome b subunit